MDAVFTIIGVVGSIMCILMYFMLERGLAKGSDIWYYAINGIGALLILIGCMANFDGGDLGAITQELCWAMISGMGIFRLIRAKKKERNEGF